MIKLQRMSETEKEIMQRIWAAGGPVTSAYLLGELGRAGRDWKASTVLTFLARLVEKGLLTAVRRGRSNEYVPRVAEADYRLYDTRQFLDDVHDGSVKSLIAALFDGGELTVRELGELRTWFDEREGAD
jgi:predicted transcriptional regulator